MTIKTWMIKRVIYGEIKSYKRNSVMDDNMGEFGVMLSEASSVLKDTWDVSSLR